MVKLSYIFSSYLQTLNYSISSICRHSNKHFGKKGIGIEGIWNDNLIAKSKESMFREIDFIINQSKMFYDYYTLKSFSYFNNVAKNGYLDPIGFFFIYNLHNFFCILIYVIFFC